MGRLYLLDEIRHGEGFAGASDAEEHLAFEVVLESVGELLDGAWLVAGGAKVGFNAETCHSERTSGIRSDDLDKGWIIADVPEMTVGGHAERDVTLCSMGGAPNCTSYPNSFANRSRHHSIEHAFYGAREFSVSCELRLRPARGKHSDGALLGEAKFLDLCSKRRATEVCKSPSRRRGWRRHPRYGGLPSAVPRR